MTDRGRVTRTGGWFAGLPAAQRAALHSRGTTRRFRAGATLFHEGDPSDWVVLLTEGRIKIASLTADGRDVVLSVCAPGELTGATILGRRERPAYGRVERV